MSIQSTNPNTPGNLFHAVGKDWKGRFIMNFIKIKADEATMIADGLIPYLTAKYGSKVHQFFDPEAVVDKEDWFWDEDKKMIVNPLTKELDGLEDIDSDYDFSDVMGQEENNKDKAVPKAMSEGFTPPATAEELAVSRLNMVVTGGEEDSVSTLGNANSPSVRAGIRTSRLIPAMGVSGEKSVITAASMESRMTAMEERLVGMEANIQNSFESSIASIFAKMQHTQLDNTAHEPPGGASAGGQDD